MSRLYAFQLDSDFLTCRNISTCGIKKDSSKRHIYACVHLHEIHGAKRRQGIREELEEVEEEEEEKEEEEEEEDKERQDV